MMTTRFMEWADAMGLYITHHRFRDAFATYSALQGNQEVDAVNAKLMNRSISVHEMHSINFSDEILSKAVAAFDKVLGHDDDSSSLSEGEGRGLYYEVEVAIPRSEG